MSRTGIILISSIILMYSIYINNRSSLSELDSPDIEDVSGFSPDKLDDDTDTSINPTEVVTNEENDIPNDIGLPVINNYTQPENGFSPYNEFFGKGIYNNSSGNIFLIKNSNETDAVVLLVDVFSGKKVRNEYIRKGSDFSMTGVPIGTYYLQWSSGNKWNPNKRIGRLTGGFDEDASFAKTQNSNDWMSVSFNERWSVTLYSVVGGDVETDKISALEFSN